MINLHTSQKIGAIQSLRAVAAALVLFQHVTYYVLNARGIDYLPYLRIDFGRIGVLLFFTISGFVMMGCLEQRRAFIWHRITRLYPGFWLAIAASAVLLADPQFAWHFDFKSTFLVPTANLNNSYRIPYWTLIYELAFYSVIYAFILLRLDQRLLTGLTIAWLALIVITSKYTSVPFFTPGPWVLLSTANTFFIFGMLCALYRNSLVRIPSVVLAVVGITCWSIGDLWKESTPMQGYLLLGFAFSSVIVLSLKHLRFSALERIGDISYGVYLIHVPIAVALIALMKQHAPETRTSVMWAVTILVTACGSAVFGLLEFQMYKKFFKLRSQKSSAISVPA